MLGARRTATSLKVGLCALRLRLTLCSPWGQARLVISLHPRRCVVVATVGQESQASRLACRRVGASKYKVPAGGGSFAKAGSVRRVDAWQARPRGPRTGPASSVRGELGAIIVGSGRSS